MRTNIVLNEKLVKDAIRLSGVKTKEQVIELALENLIAFQKRKKMKTLFGKVVWEGNLTLMRSF